MHSDVISLSSTFQPDVSVGGCIGFRTAPAELQLCDLDLAAEAAVHVRPGDNVPVVGGALLLQGRQLTSGQHTRPQVQPGHHTPAGGQERAGWFSIHS